MAEKNAFAKMTPTVENHYWLVSRGAIFRLIFALKEIAERSDCPPDDYLQRYPFLSDLFEEMRPFLPEHLDWDETFSWWNREMQEWEAQVPDRFCPPLRRLAQISPDFADDRFVLMLVGFIEEDIRFGSLFAQLQDPLPSRRMSQGLLRAIFPLEAEQAVSRLVAQGLLVQENRDAPRAEWILRVPLPIWDTLKSATLPDLTPAICAYACNEFPALGKLLLPDTLRRQVQRLPDLIARNEIGGVVVRGMANSGRRTLVGALAKALERDVLHYDRKSESPDHEMQEALLGALCLLTGAFPVISAEPSAGETVTIAPIKGYSGAVGFVLPREGGISGAATERTLTLNLPSPTAEERLHLWQNVLGDKAGEEAETMASHLRLPFGAICQVAQLANAYATLEGRSEILANDVLHASRSLNRQTLDTLAERLAWDEATPKDKRWARLIVNPTTTAELRDLENRCRYREQIAPSTNPQIRASVNSGVRSLFSGGSGTGKTLAAQTLASVLEKDIYRVDLAGIVNKYVGETEKNLSRLLNCAEELDIILLIDEGDSLMAGRTDVKSSNDRYANQETNYLLQRLESYEGIVFVTTNASSRVDSAFERRFDAVIDFYAPETPERLRLWQLHLPPKHQVPAQVLYEIADGCNLTGGQIRNAALHAVLLATVAGRKDQVNEDDVRQAVLREYRKMGAASPLEASGVPNLSDPIAQFLEEVR